MTDQALHTNVVSLSAAAGPAVPAPSRVYAGARRIFGVRRSALIEMVALLLLLTVYDRIAGDSSRFFSYVYHPFWAVMLLIVIQYGLPEALACAALSSVFLLAGNLPDQQMTETLYDYFLRVSHLPLMWLVVAVIAGEIRSRQINEKERLTQGLAQANKREKAIAREYNNLKGTKEKLEARLSEESCSLASVYHAASALQTLDEESLLKGLKDIVSVTLHPDKFSLFLWQDESLQLAFSQGWEDDHYRHSFSPQDDLYYSVVKAKRVMCITHADDEMALAEEGLIAAPIVDPRSGELYGMLKIEKIAFSLLTFSTEQTLTQLAQWAGMAIANAKAYHRRGQKVLPMPVAQHPHAAMPRLTSDDVVSKRYARKTQRVKPRYAEPAL